MMGFFNFLGKKNNESKKKTGGIKKQVMQVFKSKNSCCRLLCGVKEKKE